MTCEECHEVLSARLDAEATPAEEATLARHLAGCPACRRWEQRLLRLTRGARLEPGAEAPDLTGAVLDRLLGATDDRVPALAPVVATVVPADRCDCHADCGCGCRQGRACRCDSSCAGRVA